MFNALRKIKSGLNCLARGYLKFLEKLANEKVIIGIILVLCFTIAIILRIMPMKWGIYLTEFDPFYEYYLAKEIVQRGWYGVIWWFQRTFGEPTYDKLFWYPYGRDLRATSQPGAALTSAIIYMILKSLGFHVSLYVVHAFVPAIGASLATFAIYLFGKRMWRKEVGLLAALVMATTPAYLSRTMLGGKHEGVAIPAMIFAFYAFFRSIENDSLLWSIIAGISMGLVVLSWGGYIYPWNLMGLYIISLVLLGKLDKIIARNYLIMNIITTAFIAITPRFGPKMAFMSISALVPMVANLVSILVILYTAGLIRKRTLYERKTLALIAIALIGFGFFAWYKGILAGIALRLIAVINPQLRSAIIESVGEHRVPSWCMLYSDYQSLLLFFFFGLYLLLKNFDYKSLFLVLFSITSLYSAMSLARLTLLFSPALATVASIGFYECVKALIETLKEKEKGKIKLPKYRREYTAIALTIVILITLPSIGAIIIRYNRYSRTIEILSLSAAYSHQPSILLTSTLGGLVDYDYQYLDWVSALEWMKENLPKNAVIMCWWDYGYWISVNTGRRTVADNGTINTTQIAMIALAFLSPEEKAIQIMKKYNITYVVVFERFRSLADFGFTSLGSFYLPDPIGYGDFGKSYWMIKIASQTLHLNLTVSEYQTNATIEYGGYRFNILVPANTNAARNATLYKLIFMKTSKRMFFVFERIPPYFGQQKLPVYKGPLINIPPPKYFKLVYASYPNQWVLVYKVLYDKYYEEMKKANATAVSKKI